MAKSSAEQGGSAGASDGLFWRIYRGELPAPPAARTLGMEINAVDPDAGTIEVRFQAVDAFLNPAGTVQGGFLAAMLDDTLGPCLLATLAPDQVAPTLNLNTSFHAPAGPGLLVGRARIVHRGGSIASVSGELYQGDQLIASAQATAKVISLAR